MARYIDADKLLEETTLDVLHNSAMFVYLAMRGMVRKAPTADVVEVVRCKDCEYKLELNDWEKTIHIEGCIACTQIHPSGDRVVMLETDFCSYGERKDT